jgi:hypothetical protein
LKAEADGIEVAAEWGDMFWPESLKDRTRNDVLGDAGRPGHAAGRPVRRPHGRRGEPVPLRRPSSTGTDPDLVVDCVNTATAFAYQNIFASATELRRRAEADECSRELVERHLATLYLPQLIRHVQIALESMRRAGTRMYLKIGTAGTGGMGLNIPFTHSEERPSRMLLAKSGVAGAHTLLLYLMARTPGAPAVREIKPTAAISWKRVGYGEVKKRGRPWSATTPPAPSPSPRRSATAPPSLPGNRRDAGGRLSGCGRERPVQPGRVRDADRAGAHGVHHAGGDRG